MLRQRRRYWREILGVELRFWVSQRRITSWIERTDLFFVLGLGRSGTTFLASLLNQAAGAYVVHEPLLVDFVAYPRAFHEPNAAQRYITGFRKKEIYLRARRRSHVVYGEVNSVLRRHALALRDNFPDATLLHLVRDGRDVVRSMIARQTLLPDDPSTIGIRPEPDDPWAREWEQMDRFARLCWYWQVENAYLRQVLGQAVKFEEILKSYDYFEAEILAPCGVEVPYAIWEQAVNRPQNVTKRHRLPSWEMWSDSQQKTFLRICGDEMRQYGYEL